MNAAQLAGFRMMAECLTDKPAPQAVTVTAPDGRKAIVQCQPDGGFWFDHPMQGRIWVPVFTAK
jgi:hypothetical protein